MDGLLSRVDAVEVEIRRAVATDASALLALQRRLAAETTFMLREPDEVPRDPAHLARHLDALAARDNAVWFVAVRGGELVGLLGAEGGLFARIRAKVRIFLGVARAHWGEGIGRRLLAAVDTWAQGAPVLRLELTVLAGNTRARILYERMGYVVEGRLRGSMVIGERSVDELVMAKLL